MHQARGQQYIESPLTAEGGIVYRSLRNGHISFIGASMEMAEPHLSGQDRHPLHID
jgi:hypothetical protein